MDRVIEFAGNHTLLVVALATSFLLVVFTELRRKASGALNVDPGGAVRLINDDALVIDMRSAEAFGKGHIAGARNIPADELDARLDSLASFKSKPVIVACDAGISSTKAVHRLQSAGFAQAVGLKGGMSGWSQAGLPVVTGRKTRAKGKKGRK